MARYLRDNKARLLGILLAVTISTNYVQARPYYYFFQDAPKPAGIVESSGQAVQQAGGQIQQAANQMQKVAGEQISAAGGEPPIQQRIGGHLNELYSHGSHAVRGVVDTVQPDLKNIGRDLTDAYQQTRESVSKRIEPITQTVRPFIDKAHKMIETQLSTAREEIPKAINKVGEQVQGVWGKIKSTTQGTGSEAGQVEQQQQQVQQQIQQQVAPMQAIIHQHHQANNVV